MNQSQKRQILIRVLMNIRMAAPVTEEFRQIQDAYLQEENEIYLWRGDITRLACGAIVNAANSGIAFCCISTGVFMFPNEAAAEIAVQTVKNYA